MKIKDFKTKCSNLFKKSKIIYVLAALLVLSLPNLVSANSASFSLGPNNGYYSSKDNLWYYSGSYNIDVGVQNFSGGSANFRFKRVQRWAPDATLVNLSLNSTQGSYFASVANVNDQSGYYYEVTRLSSYPKGNIFAR